jgi:hypothetical protein
LQYKGYSPVAIEESEIMSKKRMVLEEVEEKNLLVPGSPENPIKLGERQKDLILRLHMLERDDLDLDGQDYGLSMVEGYSLIYLGLVEEKLFYTPEEIAAFHEEAQSIRKMTAESILCGSTGIYTLVEDENLERKAKKTVWRLTEAGKALLLSGKVTVAL